MTFQGLSNLFPTFLRGLERDNRLKIGGKIGTFQPFQGFCISTIRARARLYLIFFLERLESIERRALFRRFYFPTPLANLGKRLGKAGNSVFSRSLASSGVNL